ncbi:protocatechuate 3,4-dioxygenase subunit alpha [Devosia sp.]|uniref:protocatechuate 3,4-dioxygenase subunit alpha n=1 Tax=Devosia sp. TaxID=1871048 RepID=UPI002EE0B280
MPNHVLPLKERASQTAGPYVHIGLTPNWLGIRGVYPEDLGATMLTPDTPGERIVISGRVFDGAGAPVFDAVVEAWQADANGAFAPDPAPVGAPGPDFLGFGRCACDDKGGFRFETVKPGRVPAPDGGAQAPHVTLWIVARGINIGLHTRLYFEDEADANAEDPVLRRVPEFRRKTLVAKAAGPGHYVLDIRLQGEDETVFFDI